MCCFVALPFLLYNQLTSFLNRSDVHEDLGVGTHQWQMCSELVEKNVSQILV